MRYWGVIEQVHHRAVAFDCGTGTGQAALKLAEHFPMVLASDFSHDQVRQTTPHPSLRPFAARAELLPLRDGVVDLVTVAQAVHWFDLERFWKEVHRIGRPGAVVAIWGYGFFEVDPEVDRVVMEVLRSRVDRYWGSGNLILLDEYRTIPFPFEEIAAPRIEMTQSWTLDRLLSYVGTWSACNRYHEEHGDRLLEEAREHLLKVWPEGEKVVRMPLTLRMGRLRR